MPSGQRSGPCKQIPNPNATKLQRNPKSQYMPNPKPERFPLWQRVIEGDCSRQIPNPNTYQIPIHTKSQTNPNDQSPRRAQPRSSGSLTCIALTGRVRWSVNCFLPSVSCYTPTWEVCRHGQASWHRSPVGATHASPLCVG